MNLERIASQWLPPKLAWHLTRMPRRRRELAEFSRFYSLFLKPGDLCFDIGANLGNRTRCFRHLGCRVIAVEPQTRCFGQLEREFADDPLVILVKQALGRNAGSAKLKISSEHVLSSLSDEFVDRTTRSGRFSGAHWDHDETVEISTLEKLISQHGVPAFIKIDVEGYESEVLAGLESPVPALSIEWVPEFPENARGCVDRLSQLGDYEYNLSWGETMRFSRAIWRTPESMLHLIDEFVGETSLFGDIYARLVKPASRTHP
jgi:FkbM family methyltransferase